jgi:hypothetical protein
MFYANKKISQSHNSAQQMAQIIANVSALANKDLIRLTGDTVYLNPMLWKDKETARNWIKCLHQYYVVKKGFKKSGTLYFKDIDTDELIGTLINNKPKVLKFS